jgi:hypothetical protein
MALILRKAQGSRPGDWGPDDYDVKSGEFTVGRIYRMSNMAPPQPSWLWAINGVHGAHGVMTSTGQTQTREDAMEQFAMNWRKWLAWAGLQELS